MEWISVGSSVYIGRCYIILYIAYMVMHVGLFTKYDCDLLVESLEMSYETTLIFITLHQLNSLKPPSKSLILDYSLKTFITVIYNIITKGCLTCYPDNSVH
jgi:hypothetical protein